MKKDKIEEILEQGLQEMKEEKMQWDFENFLQKTHEQEKATIKPIGSTKSRNQKWFYSIAASIAVLFGFLLINKTVTENYTAATSKIVKNKSIGQKNSEISTDTLIVSEKNIAINDTVKTADTLEIRSEQKAENNDEAEIMNKILSRRSRLRRMKKPLLVQNDVSKKSENSDSTAYRPDYVTVNGQEIYDKEEAIKIAKGALDRMSANISKTFTEVQFESAPGN